MKRKLRCALLLAVPLAVVGASVALSPNSARADGGTAFSLQIGSGGYGGYGGGYYGGIGYGPVYPPRYLPYAVAPNPYWGYPRPYVAARFGYPPYPKPWRRHHHHHDDHCW
jgi:hypothetical protein